MQLVRIFTKTDEHGNNPYSSNERSLALFSSVSIVLLAGTMVVSLIVFFNFGKGLKDACEFACPPGGTQSNWSAEMHNSATVQLRPAAQGQE